MGVASHKPQLYHAPDWRMAVDEMSSRKTSGGTSRQSSRKRVGQVEVGQTNETLAQFAAENQKPAAALAIRSIADWQAVGLPP